MVFVRAGEEEDGKHQESVAAEVLWRCGGQKDDVVNSKHSPVLGTAAAAWPRLLPAHLSAH